MIAAIRSESLRSVSGLSLSAAYALAILVPIMVLSTHATLMDTAGLDAGAATAQLLQPLAWCFIGGAFVGAYAVTREYYYASMDRTLTELGFRRAFWGKMVAGSIMALALSLCIFAVWTVVVWFILQEQGLSLSINAEGLRIYAGSLLGVLLGAIAGGAVGWITRNYYVGAAIVLAYPLALEFALLGNAPEIARFAPGMTLAALSVPGYQEQLLDFLPAACLAIAWTGALALVSWYLGRRRVA